MSESSKTVSRGGVSFLSLLGILFIGLKLTGHIDWSWWLVLAPLYLPWSIIIAVFILGATLAVIGALLSGK